MAAILLALASEAAAAQDPALPFLEKASSLMGSTGWINVPSPSLQDSGMISAAIHRREAKVNFGLAGLLEGGFFFEADRLGAQFEPYRDLSSWDKVKLNLGGFTQSAFRGQAKIRLADESWAGISLAAGVEQDQGYVTAQRHFPNFSRMTLLAGWGGGRFKKGFVGLRKSLFSGAEAIFEYDGEGLNVGLRMLLAPNLILDVAMKDLNTLGEVKIPRTASSAASPAEVGTGSGLGGIISEHFLFGVTYTEKIW